MEVQYLRDSPIVNSQEKIVMLLLNIGDNYE